jgi:hypothetical protein
MRTCRRLLRTHSNAPPRSLPSCSNAATDTLQSHSDATTIAECSSREGAGGREGETAEGRGSREKKENGHDVPAMMARRRRMHIPQAQGMLWRERVRGGGGTCGFETRSGGTGQC